MAYEIVAVGASWGGMNAVGTILEALPRDFELPIVVAQHRGTGYDEELLERILEQRSALPVVAVSDKDPIRPGHVHVAPPDYHVLVERGHFELSTEDFVQFARPSIDVLFESVAGAYRERAVGVLLTGLNEDGAAGIAALAEAGGFTVAQDPATADKAEMPQAAITRGGVRRILPLEEIGPFLAALRTGVPR